MELSERSRTMKWRKSAKTLLEGIQTETIESKNAQKDQKPEIIYYANEYLAVRNEDNTFYLCTCLENVKESMKKFSIRWLDNVNGGDIYCLSYNDKISSKSVVTNVQIDEELSQYKLSVNERTRINNLLKKSLDAELQIIPRAETQKKLKPSLKTNRSTKSITKNKLIKKRTFKKGKTNTESLKRIKKTQTFEVIQSTIDLVQLSSNSEDRVLSAKNEKMFKSRISSKIPIEAVNRRCSIRQLSTISHNQLPNTTSVYVDNSVQPNVMGSGSVPDYETPSNSIQEVNKAVQPNITETGNALSLYQSPDNSAVYVNNSVHPIVIGSGSVLQDYETPNNSIQEVNSAAQPNNTETGNALSLYQSPDNSAASGGSGNINNVKKRIDKKWRKAETYDSEDEVLRIIHDEGIWSKQTKSKTDIGERVYYRCNRIKSKAKIQCNSGLCISYSNDSLLVTIFRSMNDHNHDDLLEKSNQPINDETGAAIKNLLAQGYRRKEILNELHKLKLNVPSKNQLNAYIVKVNQETYGKSRIKLSELLKFLEDRSIVPEDSNKPFVLDYMVSDADKTDIRFDFMVSSKKLLSNAIGKKLIVADTTYKIIWQGFPVSPIGTVDQDKHFHLIGMGVSTNEQEELEQEEDFTFFFKTMKRKVLELLHFEIIPNIILCDAAKAISNAFCAIFGDHCLVLMCWFHMKKAIKKNIGLYFPKEMHELVFKDIDFLQLSRSPEIFENASRLFLQKYSAYEDFIVYFQYEWLEQNRNWYEGAAERTPSTNNALESFNRYLKEERTLRNRLPLAEFTIKLLDWIESWSIEYDSGAKSAYSDKTTITLNLYTKGYQWSRMDKLVKQINFDNEAYFLVPPAVESRMKNNPWTEMYNWESFDEFKTNSFEAWKVHFDENDWRDSRCTCPAFYKEFMCKHIIGIALRLQVAIAPPEAKTVEIGCKRKRGRPAKAKKALIIQ